MADEKLIVEIDLEKGETKQALSEIETDVENAGKKSGEKFSESFGSAVKGAVAQAAKVTALIASVASALAVRESIAAAQSQENAVQSLNTSLALAGTFSREASRDIQKFASDLQEVTTVGDETTLAMFGLARNITRTNEQAKELTEAAVQLSAATGLSLESSVKNLGKTFSGLTGELGESLPAVKDFTIEQLKAGKAIEFVLSRFGGAAEGKVNSFSGAIKQLTNAFGDSLEQQGFIITKSPTLIKTIQTLTKWFADSAKSTKKFADEIGDIFLPIANFLIKIASSINKHLLAPMENAFGRLKELFIQSFGSFENFFNILTSVFSRAMAFTVATFQTMTNAVFGFATGTIRAISTAMAFVEPFVSSIVGLISRVFESTGLSLNGIISSMINGITSVIGILQPVLEKMGVDTDKVIGRVKSAMESMIPEGDTVASKFSSLTDKFSTFKNKAIENLTGMKEFITDQIGGSVDAPLSDKFQARLDEYKMFINSAKGLSEEFKNNMNGTKDALSADFTSTLDVFKGVMGGFTSNIFGSADTLEGRLKIANKTVSDFANRTGLAMRQGIGQAAGGAFAQFGAALQKGENALEAFGEAFLASIGQVLVQQGTAFMLQGAAYAFSGMPSLMALSGGLIASGAAMAAFGGFLSASVSPQGGGGAGGGGGGAAGGGVENELDLTAPENVERNAPSTNVEVIVQGSLVQQEELGTFLTETLNESFGKQGVTLTDARFA